MEMYLQFGYGMMEHSRVLVQDWGGGTVILSPRDLSPKQIATLSRDIRAFPGGTVLLDPQFYLPHSNHNKLAKHDYWPDGYSTGTFYSGPPLFTLISKLIALNNNLGTRGFIIPGLYATEFSDHWISTQLSFLEATRRQECGRTIYQTIAISSEVCRNTENIGRLIDFAERYPADGYYIVCEHPREAYLVADSTWTANLLDLAAGLKLLGAQVIIGYANQQTLIAATAKVDAIASGTWLNVRAFAPGKFDDNSDEERRTPATWYYCSPTLSEYKMPTLDTALRVGVLSDLSCPAPVLPEVARLFSGVQPSTVDLLQSVSFRHYLHHLKRQTASIVQGTFDDTANVYENMLNDVETLLTNLRSQRILGNPRDFYEAINANREALTVLHATRGGILRRRWANL